MTRVAFWIAPALAIALTVVGGERRASAQENTEKSKQSEQSASTSGQNTQSGQSSNQSTQSQSGQSQAGQSGSTSSSASGSQSGSSNQGSSSQSTAGSNQPSGGEASKQSQSSQSQAGQSGNRSNQTSSSAQGQSNTSGQQNQDRNNQARDSQNQNRDQQARDSQNRDGQSRDNNRNNNNNNNNTNVNIGVGIQFGNVTDRGIVVTNVQQSSFFYTSGIRQGDVIVSVSGRPIRSHDEFIQFISVRRGERIPVIVFRDGREETIYVVYEEGPNFQANVGNQQGVALLGVSFDTNVQSAAVIAVVHPGGPAAQVGLKPGDHIVSINGRKLNTHQDAIQLVGTLRSGDQVDLEFLQLQRTQLVLSQPGNIQASATVGGQAGVSQNTYQTNYPPAGQTQAGVQVQGNQGQTNRSDANVNRSSQPQNRNQNQPNNQNRSLVPRLRN